jgi:cellulose synthase/poly-beta-1,6-N-acetylglucosamine synthase-like glycosyltransferase
VNDVVLKILEILCIVAVALGAVPVVVGVLQYLLVPVHALRNHWPRTAPYLPRVVVVLPAWNEGAVLETSLERLMHLEYPPDRLRVFVVDDAM